MHEHGLGTWMRQRRLKSPDRTALVFADVRTSYRTLADEVDRVSAVLAGRGVGRGDAVAYLGENSPRFLQVLFACAQLGAVFVPVNTRLAPPEVAHVLGDSGAVVVIHDEEFSPVLDAAHAPARRLPTGEGTTDAPGLARLVHGVSPQDAPNPASMSLNDPAAIVYTSGTTGRAKGAVLTHGNLTWVALNCIVDYDVVSTDVALMISPLFHVASLGMGALPVLMKGATLVLEKGFEPAAALAQIQRHRVTMLSGVPTTYQLMADHPDWATTDLSSLRRLTCGGSAVPTRILDVFELRGLSFTQGYGMTESSPGATALASDATRRKQGSVGLAHFFTEVRIMGEDGTPAAVREVGEIQISGPNVFAGYHGDPAATAATLTDDGWLRSGDLGYLDEDGFLFIVDRLKDMIISGGENVYPAEVENLLSDLPGVTGVAVIGRPDERWGEVPIAVVSLAPGADLDLGGVRAHLDGRLARYKLPKDLIVLDELPRTASGKVRKADLR